MFKRLFWLVIGAGFGFGIAFWLMRFVRDVVDRYRPERVSGDIGDALRANALVKGTDDGVGGVVVARYGVSTVDVIDRVKAKNSGSRPKASA